jgi:ferredoxin
MKIIADNDRCEANALCASANTELFPLDGDGYIDLPGGVIEVHADSEAAARLGVSLCPLQALRIEA